MVSPNIILLRAQHTAGISCATQLGRRGGGGDVGQRIRQTVLPQPLILISSVHV
jgi:hypothetical protein